MELWFVFLLLSLMLVLAVIALKHRTWHVRKIWQLLDRLLKTWRRQPGTVDLLTLLVIATFAGERDSSGNADAHRGQVHPLDAPVAWPSTATPRPQAPALPRTVNG